MGQLTKCTHLKRKHIVIIYLADYKQRGTCDYFTIQYKKYLKCYVSVVLQTGLKGLKII